MDVRNCRKCGRVFNYVMGPIICMRCRDEMESKFQEVKKFIREHPGVDIQTVSEECDVDKSQIYQWLREERLELAEGSMITLSCETCFKPIKSGRYCENCKRSLAMGFKQAVDKPVAPSPAKSQKDSSSKMRYFDMDN